MRPRPRQCGADAEDEHLAEPQAHRGLPVRGVWPAQEGPAKRARSMILRGHIKWAYCRVVKQELAVGRNVRGALKPISLFLRMREEGIAVCRGTAVAVAIASAAAR